jgi:hypothetical protein
LESICGNTDLAFDCLKSVVSDENFDPEWAWKDPDLEWIRGDERFQQIVPREDQ